MENRYRESLRNIHKNARAMERMFAARAAEAKQPEYAAVMRISAKAYRAVAEWVVDEICAADSEVQNGDKDND